MITLMYKLSRTQVAIVCLFKQELFKKGSRDSSMKSRRAVREITLDTRFPVVLLAMTQNRYHSCLY